jgi:hypothetical protein
MGLQAGSYGEGRVREPLYLLLDPVMMQDHKHLPGSMSQQTNGDVTHKQVGLYRSITLEMRKMPFRK